jgi:hypothetical protein
MKQFMRTCQECGHVQKAKDPASYKDKEKEAWRSNTCRKCKSEGSLDFGSEKEVDSEGRVIPSAPEFGDNGDELTI